MQKYTMSKQPVKTKRIYEDPEPGDGYRVLVDRLWPRGVSKEEARLDEWMKEIAPSTELRKWFDHEDSRYDEFKSRYKEELSAKDELVKQLIQKAEKQPVTLLYAARDKAHNQAVVLKEYLQDEDS